MWIKIVVGTAFLSLSFNLFAEINHVVIAWFPEPLPGSTVRLMQRDLATFNDIPGVVRVVGGAPLPSDRSIVDDSFSFAVLVVLESTMALGNYLQHPSHKAYLERYVEGKVEKVVAYDF